MSVESPHEAKQDNESLCSGAGSAATSLPAALALSLLGQSGFIRGAGS